MKNKKIKIIIGVGISIVVVAVIVVALFTFLQKKEEAERRQKEIQNENIFQENMYLATQNMLVNVSTGSSYITSYLNVMNKYSYRGSEYVRSLVRSTSSAKKIESLMKSTNEDVVKSMNILSSNKNEKHQDVYNILLEMYDSYNIFYENSIDLNFDLYSSTELVDKGKDVIEKYNRIKVMYPSVQERPQDE